MYLYSIAYIFSKDLGSYTKAAKQCVNTDLVLHLIDGENLIISTYTRNIKQNTSTEQAVTAHNYSKPNKMKQISYFFTLSTLVWLQRT